MKRLGLQSAELHNDAHTHFARMRREEPVYRARFSRTKDIYLVTRYADVERLLKGEELVKDPAHSVLGSAAKHAMWLPKTLEPLMKSMLMTDDPEHRRLRKLVSKAFTPKSVSALEPVIEQVAQRLVARMVREREVDLIRAYAQPLPVHVITEMVGVPEEDRARFERWVHDIVRAPSVLNMARMLPALMRFMRYLRALAGAKRQAPGDDLLSALVHVEDEGERLSEDELVGMIFLLLVAGHETTVSLIANGTLALLSHPQELARLRADPSLMGSAIEELLRFDGPLLGTELYYARDTFTLHDVTVPAGAAVLPAVLSANRDAAAFDDADVLDIARAPNRHLAFGKGAHHCIGAPLARLEGKVAFTTLLDAIPKLRLGVRPEALRYRNAMFLHRLESLPVAVV